jgi:hypothetical protein
MTIEQTALSLYQLLGAPLYALIEAETYAANATADFIERMGFEPSSKESEKSPAGDLGKLRTLTFVQERRTSQGESASYKVEVPLLSILPVPALQIREADLEFYVKIIDMVSGSQPAAVKGSRKTSSESARESSDMMPAGSRNVPTPPRLDMKAMLGRGQPNAPSAAQTSFDMQVHIKIKVAQADVPAGLSRLFNLMEQSISSTKIDE